MTVLNPGERGSNGYHGKREPYIRKNILKRNYAQLTQEAIDRHGVVLRKPKFSKYDLSCRQYGTLVAMNCVGLDRWREAWWSVVCICGNIDIVRAKNLVGKHVTHLPCCKRIKLPC